MRKLEGVIPVLLTPFTKKGEVDEPALSRLPFWMQTRPETINDYNMKKLKSVGLHRVSFGVEHGNEEFRARVLKRKVTKFQGNGKKIIWLLNIQQ